MSRSPHSTPLQPGLIGDRFDVPLQHLNRIVRDVAVGEARASPVIANHAKRGSQPLVPAPSAGVLPLGLKVRDGAGRVDERNALADLVVGNADAVGAPRELDAWLHHSYRGRTAKIRCASATPFSATSPRSSNATAVDVRASARTTSDTSTSPGADSAAILAATFTAPPNTF